MKKSIFIIGLFLLIPLITYGATEKSLYITCSVVVPSDVEVVNYSTVSNWNLLNKNFSFVSNRDVAAVVSNSSTANETFRLAVESLGTVGVDGWTNSTTTANGNNIYVLQALFGPDGGSKPADAEYQADDVVIVTPQSASATVFGNGTAYGYNVPNGAKRTLWMRFTFPSSGVANPVQPTCRLIITAQVQ